MNFSFRYNDGCDTNGRIKTDGSENTTLCNLFFQTFQFQGTLGHIVKEPLGDAWYAPWRFFFFNYFFRYKKVLGLTFERAITSLVFDPLGLSHSLFNRDDIMTRRFAVGYNPGDDGTLTGCTAVEAVAGRQPRRGPRVLAMDYWTCWRTSDALFHLHNS